jgi:peptidoglycan/LPS O-acetylase OafA/YrhL
MSSLPAVSSAIGSPPNRDQKRYESLDAVRGIAALIVVFHHCLLIFPVWSDVALHNVYPTPPAAIVGHPPFSLLWNGSAAVNVFFVLSGFVLALLFLRPNAPGYPAFVVKRICRIYLPYIAVIAIAMLLMTATAPHNAPELSEWIHLSWTGPVTGPLVASHLLMLSRENTVDNPAWSLFIEMRYSLVFPLIMFFVIRLKGPILVALLFLSLAAIPFLDRIEHIPLVNSLRYTFLFVGGAVLAKYKSPVREWFQNLSSFSRIALGVTSLACVDAFGSVSQLPSSALAAVTPQFGALLLLATVVGSRKIHRFLVKKPLLWLGRISYSLYLSHVVLLLTLVWTLHTRVPMIWIALATPPLALLLADVLYRLIEHPSIELGHTLEKRLSRKS